MTYQPWHIAAYEEDSGLNTYYEPFLIPEKAFPILEDAFAWRGRVRRRPGFSHLGRIRRVISQQALANTDGTGTYTAADILTSFRGTQPNAEVQTSSVTVVISRGMGDETSYTDNGSGTLSMVPGGTYTISAGSINYISGAISLTFTVVPANGLTVDVSYAYFPALPVMGLPSQETATQEVNNLIAFDTRYAYTLSGGQFIELPPGSITWNGNNSDFFWCTQYYQNTNGILFWITNFNKGGTPDPIRYWDTTAYTLFEPTLDGAGNKLEQARIILAYKNRLLMFNTYEGATLAAATQHPQRLRFSQNGDPTDQTNGWRSDVVGRGGFIDIPTSEEIITAFFVKDVLLVKCERSSWKVVYTGNETLPFVFQKINAELGAESTFSAVPFDNGVYTVSNYGVTNDDSINVYRIDQQIPNYIFNINNSQNGIKRVYGIRDYYNELVYWTYPFFSGNPAYPNRIMVYNYANKTYATFHDSFTCFGYFQRSSGLTWATLPYRTWASWTNSWNSGIGQASFPNIVGGNQQGFVSILAQQVYNDVSLAITAITQVGATNVAQLTVPSHNLVTGQFVEITGILGTGSPNPDTLNGEIYRIIVASSSAIQLELYNSTTEVFETVTLAAGGTYIGNGKLTVLNNINISTKVFAPFYDQGAQCRFPYVDFLMDKTQNGEVSVNCYINENNSTSINDPNDPGNSGLLGDNIIETSPDSLVPMQNEQLKIWKRLFIQAVCQNFQLEMFMDDVQMSSKDINSSDITLHAMTLYLSKNARMVQ